MSGPAPAVRGLVWTAAALGLLAAIWVFTDAPDRLVSGESVDPCRSPLAWHLGRVDPRFGFTAGEVRRAVDEAAMAWERAAERDLFRRDSAASMPIHLVYDHRQATQERRASEERTAAELRSEVEALEGRLEALQSRVRSDEARYRQDPTPAHRRAYRSSLDRYNGTVEHYNQVVRRYNAAAESLRAREPAEIRAGNLYQENRTLAGRVVGVDRALTIALAGSYQELVLVLTHELGHALGLGHVAEEGAVMVSTYRDDEVPYPIRLHPADRRALARRCGSAG